MILTVKEFLKSANIYQNYITNKWVQFFLPFCGGWSVFGYTY